MRAFPSLLQTVCAVALCSAIFAGTGCSVGDLSSPGSSTNNLVTGTLKGVAHGGQQPLAGAAIYLFAASTSGYGSASVSLLRSVTTGSFPTTPDRSGNYYVTTDANGNFSVSSYTCTTGTVVYVYALGGDPGAGPNSASGLLAVLGVCPASGTFLGSIPFIVINEVTTVAAAYSLAGFTTDPTHVASSSTPGSLLGMRNAAATANNLADITGSTNASGARSVTPSGYGFPPQAEINTLADILAACINSAGQASPACTTLFADARLNGATGARPTDTAAAIINIAHNPENAAAALFSLGAGTAAPFQPTLAAAYTDWSLAVVYYAGTGGWLIGIDGTGNVWTGMTGVSKYSNLGVLVSPPYGGYPNSQLPSLSSFSSGAFALDTQGNFWFAGGIYPVVNLNELSNTGQTLSGDGYVVPGQSSSLLTTAEAIAIDPQNNPQILTSVSPVPVQGSNPYYGVVNRFSPAGALLRTLQSAGSSSSMAIDAAGNTWLDSGVYAVNSSLTGYTAGPFSRSSSAPLLIDAHGNAWFIQAGLNYLHAGTVSVIALTGPNFTVPVNQTYVNGAFDGLDHLWVTYGGLMSYSDTGTLLTPAGLSIPGPSPAPGYNPTPFAAYGVAIDGSGNIWVTNSNYIYNASPARPTLAEFIGRAAPTVTPLAAAVAASRIGALP